MTSFEYSPAQDVEFKKLAQKAIWIAVALLLLAAYQFSRIIFPEPSPSFIADTQTATYWILAIVPDICLIASALNFLSAASSYRAIVKTQGNDLSLFLLGNDKMKQAFIYLAAVMLLYSLRFALFMLHATVVLER